MINLCGWNGSQKVQLVYGEKVVKFCRFHHIKTMWKKFEVSPEWDTEAKEFLFLHDRREYRVRSV